MSGVLLYCVAEAAALLGLPERALRVAIARGAVPVVRFGRSVRVVASYVNARPAVVEALPVRRIRQAAPLADITICRRTSHVYFLQQDAPNGPVKIGFSADASRRKLDLEAANPQRLVIRAAIGGKRSGEQAMHHRFHDLRIGREWFAFRDDLRAYIEALSDAGTCSHEGRP